MHPEDIKLEKAFNSPALSAATCTADEPAIPVYKLRWLPDGERVCRTRLVIDMDDAAAVFADHFKGADREHFSVLFLDSGRNAIGIHDVAVGNIDTVVADARDVFKAALYANANAIIGAHNHVGDTSLPSEPDKMIHARFQACGEIIGIEWRDSLIIASDGSWTSVENYLATNTNEGCQCAGCRRDRKRQAIAGSIFEEGRKARGEQTTGSIGLDLISILNGERPGRNPKLALQNEINKALEAVKDAHPVTVR